MTETFIQPKITGYRQLTTEEAALMNEIKEHGVSLDNLIKKLKGVIDTDITWISTGKEYLQLGLMALTRAVARPTSF